MRSIFLEKIMIFALFLITMHQRIKILGKHLIIRHADLDPESTC